MNQSLKTTHDGIAMRFLPSDTGSRMVRPRPPYWNNCGKVACCEVGDKFLHDSSASGKIF